MRVTEPASRPIRALLIDDHALFRQSVALSLSADPNLSIEHCASIRNALTLLSQQSFDLVLLDHDLGAERASQFLPAAGRLATRDASWWSPRGSATPRPGASCGRV